MNCRVCRSPKVKIFLDLGMMPLAGGFLKKGEFSKEKRYRLEIGFCQECYLVQIGSAVPRQVLFKEYKYLSSVTQTLQNHFRSLAKEISSLSPRFVVEVGCNDGVLLQPLRTLGVDALGVEPAHNVASVAKAKGLNVMEGFFGVNLAKKILGTFGPSDLVTGSNVFAHIENIADAFDGVKTLLTEEGTLIIEVHNVLDLLKKLQYDFFYHEHVFYYSLLSISNMLRRFGFLPYRVQRTRLHGGSIRVFATRNEGRKIDESVARMMAEERRYGVDRLETYLEFSRRVMRHRDSLYETIMTVSRRKEVIVGYGASGRATTLLNFLRLPAGIVAYIVDDSPARQNLYLPGTHTPICGPAKLRERVPDYIFLLAWSYEVEIRKKVKLPMIVPFPEPRFVGRRN